MSKAAPIFHLRRASVDQRFQAAGGLGFHRNGSRNRCDDRHAVNVHAIGPILRYFRQVREYRAVPFAEMGVGNATIATDPPDELLQKVKDDHRSQKASAVLMFAVLEHMKIEERLNSLQTCWDCLADGGVLIVGDTPNRLVYRHGHTSRYPFFDMTPDTLMLKYANRFPNPAFVSSIKMWQENNLPSDEIEDRIDRWGRGVIFHNSRSRLEA